MIIKQEDGRNIEWSAEGEPARKVRAYGTDWKEDTRVRKYQLGEERLEQYHDMQIRGAWSEIARWIVAGEGKDLWAGKDYGNYTPGLDYLNREEGNYMSWNTPEAIVQHHQHALFKIYSLGCGLIDEWNDGNTSVENIQQRRDLVPHWDGDVERGVHANGDIGWFTPLFGKNVPSGLQQGKRLHRDDGEPAKIFANGDKVWYHMGVKHRVDGPAVMCVNGDMSWYFMGQQQATRLAGWNK